ncbi:unnamed protein product [Rhizopus microsporus]
MDIVHANSLIHFFTILLYKLLVYHTFIQPLSGAYISSVLILSNPTASAFSLPSAIIATTAPTGKSSSIRAPLDVNPGHMILAPDKTNLIAPRSTCSFGRISGSMI